MTLKPILAAGFLICIASALIIGDAACAETERLVPGLRAPPKSENPLDSRVTIGPETVVPIAVEAGFIIVDVSIDGRGPFPMVFDTGAENAVTPGIAAALGLKTEGSDSIRDSGGNSIPVTYTKVRAFRLGDVELTDQPLVVVALPRHLTDRGSRPPLAGFVG